MASKFVLFSFLWQYGERLTVQGISFLVTLVLARLLLPEEYGTISIVLIFIAILEVFVNSGLGVSLVQKKTINETDYSTVFYYSLLISIVLYAIMYYISPFIGDAYSSSELPLVLRLMSIRIIISSLSSVQSAKIQRELLFKLGFYSSLISTIASAILGISAAYKGLGVFALVIQYLSASFLNSFVLLFSLKWYPRLGFSYAAMKEMIGFGWKLLFSGLLNTIFAELKGFVIGTKYTPANLAFYDKGKQFPSLVYENLNTSIGKVLFPLMSQMQDDKGKIKNMISLSLKVLSYVLLPVLMILIATGEALISFLFSDKWLPAVPFLRIACVTYSFVILNTVFTNAINAVGRSDIHLKVEFANIAIGTLILLASMNFGTIYIALSVTVSSLLCALCRLYLCFILFQYSVIDFLKDYLLPYAISGFSLVIMLLMAPFIPGSLCRIIFVSILGVIIHLILCYIFCSKTLKQLKEILFNIRSDV